MAIKYRKAEIADIPELVRLRIEFLGVARDKILPPELIATLETTNTEFMTTGLLDGSLVVFIAEDFEKGGKIIATSGIMFYRLMPNPMCADGKRAYIANMYTIPDYRRKGIATRLVELQLDEARARGVKAVFLSATSEGRFVYNKIGFEKVEDEMIYRF